MDKSIVIFDVKTGDTHSSPLDNLLGDARPAWNADGRFIAMGDGLADGVTAAVIVQPSTRRVLGAQPSPVGGEIAFNVSPLVDPRVQVSLCPEFFASKTIVRDLSDGSEREVLGCDDGFYESLEWLTDGRNEPTKERYFIVRAANCTSCDNIQGYRVALVSAASGVARKLTDGLEWGANYDVSPDGQGLLVGGKKLRVYRDGMLQREIEPPAGFFVMGVAWSPDGSGYVYVVGPRIFMGV